MFNLRLKDFNGKGPETTETLEKDVISFKDDKDTRMKSTVFWCLYCYFEAISDLFLVFILLILNK